MRTTIARSNILVIATLLFSSYTANATQIYIGAGIGQSEYDELGTDASILDDGSIIAANINDTDTGVRLFIGADINQNLNIEIGYVDLGEFTIDSISDGSGFYAPGRVSLAIPVDGVDLSIIGKLPVGSTGNLTIRAGFFMWDAKVRLGDTTGSVSVSDDGNDTFFALGGEFRLAGNIWLRGEYAMYDLDGTDLSLLSASLSYYLD